MPSWFPYAWALVAMIYHAAIPELKAEALDKLKELAAKEEAKSPWLLMLISELEAVVNGAPANLPPAP